MMDYVMSIVEVFPQKVQGRNSTTWTDNLFKVDKSLKHLGQERKRNIPQICNEGYDFV